MKIQFIFSGKSYIEITASQIRPLIPDEALPDHLIGAIQSGYLTYESFSGDFNVININRVQRIRTLP